MERREITKTEIEIGIETGIETGIGTEAVEETGVREIKIEIRTMTPID